MGAKSIDEFCEDHGISRATYYNLKKIGKGPIEMNVGARRLVSDEAAERWRREREAEAADSKPVPA
jgi:predicted site-specific integrase-resolvase